MLNGTCQANQTTTDAINLTPEAAQTDSLVIFNSDMVWSQSVTAHFWLDCWY
jgi:hypothetical protein